MEMPFHQQQLEWMRQLASNRIDFLDPFFRFLNYFDTEYFFFFLIPLIWVGFSYRWGIKLFYLLTINSVVALLLKNAFGWPRPVHDLPEIGLLQIKSFGFPSGAAQTCMLLGALLIYYSKNKKLAWSIAIPYILLISFSRIYLGVHYPTDILGGWIFGFLLFLLFVFTIGPIEKFLSSHSLTFNFLLSLILPLCILLALSKTYYLGSCLGVALGVFISLKKKLYLPDEKNAAKAFLRGSIAISSLFLIFFLWPSALPEYTLSFIVALWLSLGASPLACFFLNIKHR